MPRVPSIITEAAELSQILTRLEKIIGGKSPADNHFTSIAKQYKERLELDLIALLSYYYADSENTDFDRIKRLEPEGEDEENVYNDLRQLRDVLGFNNLAELDDDELKNLYNPEEE